MIIPYRLNQFITFAPGETTKNISIPIVGDEANEPDETFRVILSDPATANLPGEGASVSAIAIGTIESDDTPTFAISSRTVSEGVGFFDIEVTLAPTVTGETFSVEYTVANGSGGDGAVSPGDYSVTQASGTLNFAANDNSETIRITIEDDDVVENDETFTITLRNPRSSGATTPVLYTEGTEATITIEDNDLPVIDISDATLTYSGNNAVFALGADSLPSGAVEIHFTPTETTTNFLAPDEGKTAGQPRSKMITFRQDGSDVVGELEIATQDDPGSNLSGTITITLNTDQSGNDYALTTDSQKKTAANVTVRRKPTISVAAVNPSVDEGSAVQYQFTSDVAVLADFAVNITLAETGGGNFLTTNPASETSVSLAAGSSHTESYTTKVDDGVIGPDSVVTLTLGTSDNYTVGTTTPVAVRVFDGTTPTGISVIALTDLITEDAANNSVVMFQVKSNSSADVTAARTINISIDDGDADFLDSASRSLTTATIPLNEYTVNVPVTIVGDTTFEIHGEIEFEILPSGGGSSTYNVASTFSSASIEVYDDDFTTADSNDAVAIFAAKSTVAETDLVAPFIVIANEAKTTSRTVNVEIGDGAGDFLAASNADGNTVTVDIPANARSAELNIALVDDSKYEATGTITATITANIGVYEIASGTYNQATVSVTSEDAQVPVITIASAAETTGITEGESFKFTVTADAAVSGTALVFTAPVISDNQSDSAPNPINANYC